MSQAVVYRVAAVAVAATIAGINPGTAQETKMPKTPLDIVNERVERKLTRPKIILGKPPPAGTYPFQVSILDATVKKGDEFNGHVCGGSLITRPGCSPPPLRHLDGEVAPPRTSTSMSARTIQERRPYPGEDHDPSSQVPNDFTENDVALLQLARAPRPGTNTGGQSGRSREEASLTVPGTALPSSAGAPPNSTG